LQGKLRKPIFLAGVREGAVALVASIPKDLTAKVQAGKLIQQIAPIVGGKGGGRPEGARGAGKDASKLDQALDEARKILGAQKL
jgi:alanyl-tRNA synthetase